MCLLDGQNSVEVLIEHQLAGRMGEYPLIVIPEWGWLEPKFKKELEAYVRAGGNLLLIGPKAAAMFKGPLGVRFVGKAEDTRQWLAHAGWMGGLKAMRQRVKLTARAKAFGGLYAANDVKGPHETAASIARWGKGRIAATYVDLGAQYLRSRTAVARDFLNALVGELFVDPIVKVAGSHYVDVVVNRIGGKLAINLVNTAGPHEDANVDVYDEVPAVGPLDVTIRTARRPKRVALVPAGRRLKYDYQKGAIHIALPRLELHEIIVVEP